MKTNHHTISIKDLRKITATPAAKQLAQDAAAGSAAAAIELEIITLSNKLSDAISNAPEYVPALNSRILDLESELRTF